MRDIIYRAKRKDNGEWVYGVPLKEGYSQEVEMLWYEYGSIAYTERVQVIPETVGQYTGLTDKNGKKIFEGDIVKTQPFYDKPYSDKRKAKQFIGVVTYKVSTFNGNRFYSKQDYSAEWGLKFNEDFGKFTHYSWGELWNCEVIGNIHDNPELLEVKQCY